MRKLRFGIVIGVALLALCFVAASPAAAADDCDDDDSTTVPSHATTPTDCSDEGSSDTTTPEHASTPSCSPYCGNDGLDPVSDAYDATVALVGWAAETSQLEENCRTGICTKIDVIQAAGGGGAAAGDRADAIDKLGHTGV